MHWLRTLLRYKLPPSHVLELGSGHGGFVALLRWAGYEAAGLELSPWVVQFSARRFGVPIHCGPVEEQDFEPASLDTIALMDVLEHLPDPAATIRHCLKLLRPDGLLLVQTPRFPEGKTYDVMSVEGDRFLELLKPAEHIYLFSERSIRAFFQQLGVEHLIFEPAIFAHYDMFLAVSRSPLRVHEESETEDVLGAMPGGSLVQALLDLNGQFRDLSRRYQECEEDRAARLRVIEGRGRRLADLHAGMAAPLRHSRYGAVSVANGSPRNEDDRSTASRLKRVAVDMTPLLPGGENGGARFVPLALIPEMSALAPEIEFVLLTSEKSHEEIAWLDAPNVRRLCVMRQADESDVRQALLLRLRRKLGERLAARLPVPVRVRLKSLYWALLSREKRRSLLRQLEVDVLFCPFTAPFFFDPAVPVVSVVYDLQYRYYPQFFTPEQRFFRHQHFTEASRLAGRLICISDYVRETVLENADVRPERVQTIPLGCLQKLPDPSAEEVARAIERLGLREGGFLLYPANFWPHKNHRILLTALGLFRHWYPGSGLALVCTGGSDDRMRELQDAAERMGLGDSVRFPGYLPDYELAALLQGCRALIFPSLYEGFGMPVLEAMAAGKPVLCSNVTSLPEVAGDAALLFDPRKPVEIARAIERLEHEPGLAADLAGRGRERARRFGDATAVARQYLDLFHAAAEGEPRFCDGLHGVYRDGWTSGRMSVTCGAGARGRELQIVLAAPGWLSSEAVTVVLQQGRRGDRDLHVIARGERKMIRREVPAEGDFFEILVDPVFVPKALGINEDERALGVVCEACRLTGSRRTVDLLPSARDGSRDA